MSDKAERQPRLVIRPLWCRWLSFFPITYHLLTSLAKIPNLSAETHESNGTLQGVRSHSVHTMRKAESSTSIPVFDGLTWIQSARLTLEHIQALQSTSPISEQLSL
jgi:hypothetical protein